MVTATLLSKASIVTMNGAVSGAEHVSGSAQDACLSNAMEQVAALTNRYFLCR